VAYGEVSVKVIIIQVCFEPQSPKKCNLLFRRTGSWTLSFSGFFIAMQRLTQVEPSFWKAQPGVHFGAMDYSVGSRVRVKLYSGKFLGRCQKGVTIRRRLIYPSTTTYSARHCLTRAPDAVRRTQAGAVKSRLS
jgi:hypothetical protein